MPIPRRNTSNARVTATAALGLLVVAGAFVGAGRHGGHGAAHAASPQKPAPRPIAEQIEATSTAADGLKPNELGLFPVLMYHSVGDPPLTGRMARYNRFGLSISAALFRQHLEMLRKDGFYPVNMRDALSSQIEVPRGMTPVVLTFDDARASQFRCRPDGSIDPNCAVGVLEAFHVAYPDWPERATFYVLPKSQYNPTPFGQAKWEKHKLAYLVEHGFELANHSTSHHPMARMDAKRLMWEMTYCADYFHRLAPTAPPMSTMALPYGIAPAKSLLPVLLGGDGYSYHNDCILMAAGGSSFAPADRRFNRLAIPRAGSAPGYIEGCIHRLHAARVAKSPAPIADRPYISDGDPETFSIPKSAVPYLDRTRLGSERLVVYADGGKSAATKAVAVLKPKALRKI